MNINNTVYDTKEIALSDWYHFENIQIKQLLVYPVEKIIDGHKKIYYYDTYESQRKVFNYGDKLLPPIIKWVVI